MWPHSSFFMLFLKKNYFNWRLIALQYCGGFCHILTWISHGWTCVPSSWTPSHLPPHPMPLGCPRSLALSALLHALNLHWSSILHVAMYMFQCSSLKPSHPHLLPLSPKVSSLHLCLLCCPACRIVGAVFLNSIYLPTNMVIPQKAGTTSNFTLWYMLYWA